MPSVEELLKEIEGADFKPKLESLATQCQEKLGMDYNAIMEFYAGEVEALKGKMPPGTSKEVINRQAFIRTRGKYKGDLLSPAKHFVGIITGVGDKFDMVRKARKIAFEAWSNDQQKAIASGVCDADGNPLDTRKEYATSGETNPNFGKPLAEHSYIKNLKGVCKEDGGKLKRFALALSEERVDLDIPIMVPVSFRANIKADNPDEYVLNQWARINFEQVESEDPDLQNVASILADNFEPYLSDCKNLADYHAKVQGDPQRYVLLNVDVDYVAPAPNPKTGNIMMIVSDDTLPDGQQGITVWVPEHLQPLDFDAGSQAIIGGSTNSSEWQGEERTMVNAQGIWVNPATRVAPSVQG